MRRMLDGVRHRDSVSLIPFAALGTARGDVAGFQSARNRQIKHVSTSAYKRVCPSCKEGEQAGPGIPGGGLGDRAVHADQLQDPRPEPEVRLLPRRRDRQPRQADRRPGLGLDGRHRPQCRPYQGREQCLHARQGRGEHQHLQDLPDRSRSGLLRRVRRYDGRARVLLPPRLEDRELAGQARAALPRDRSLGDRVARRPALRAGATGRAPAFSVKVRTNTDTLQCPTLSDGTHCFVGHGMHGKHQTIGTTSQN